MINAFLKEAEALAAERPRVPSLHAATARLVIHEQDLISSAAANLIRGRGPLVRNELAELGANCLRIAADLLPNTLAFADLVQAEHGALPPRWLGLEDSAGRIAEQIALFNATARQEPFSPSICRRKLAVIAALAGRAWSELPSAWTEEAAA